MNTKTIATLLAIALIAAAAYWLGNQRGEQTAHTMQDGQVTIHRANTPNAPDAPPERNDKKKAKQKLPNVPNDTALVNRFDALKQRAESGDRKATCELVRDLNACKDFRLEEISMEMMTESLASSEEDTAELSDEMVDFMATEQERLERLKRMCGHLPERMKKQAFLLQKMGVEQGIEHIQIQFLINPALSQERFLDELPKWQTYKQMAPNIAEQLLQTGKLEAVTWLAELHSEHASHGGIGFAMPDRIKGLTYHMLSRRLVAIQYDDENMAGMDEYTKKIGRYTQAEIEQAQAQAESLQKQYFSHWQDKYGEVLLANETLESDKPDVDCNQL